MSLNFCARKTKMDSTMTDSAERTTIEDSDPERLILYRSTVQNCLQAISSSVKIDEFTSLFKTAPQYRRKPHLISHFHNILTKFINESVYQQVEEHIEEVGLLDKFSNLEKLTLESSANQGKECWRPSPDVRKDLRSYVMQQKMAYKEELERMVTAKEDSVNKLKYEIMAGENRAKKLEERMTSATNCLDTINKYLDDEGEAIAS